MLEAIIVVPSQIIISIHVVIPLRLLNAMGKFKASPRIYIKAEIS